MNDIQLTALLRQLRKDHGYSQEYVAEKLHIVRSTYSHYETGRITPTFNSLINLARLYAVPSAVFLSFITTYYTSEEELYADWEEGTKEKVDRESPANTCPSYGYDDRGCFFVEFDEISDYICFSESCNSKSFRLRQLERIILYYIRFIDISHAEAILFLLKSMKKDAES